MILLGIGDYPFFIFSYFRKKLTKFSIGNPLFIADIDSLKKY